MRTKQIIAIVGLRRVGKTVLAKQILAGLNEKENTFYFMFDELVTRNPAVLEDLLDYYLKNIAKEGRKYIFLDEVQKVDYWEDVLKRYYDTREDIKFVVTGSASLKIKKSKESLAGRAFDFYMPLLTFREFIELNGFEAEKAEIGGLRKYYEHMLNKKPVFEKLFSDYVFKGAFPEMAKEEDEEIIKNYVRNSVINKIIFEDIPAVVEVKKKELLASALEYCAKETAGLLDITNLAATLKVNYITMRSYIFYLKHSFVIDIAYNYSKSIAKQLRKNKKVHIAHPSITMTLMRYQKSMPGSEDIMGRFVESIIYQHSRLIGEKVSFWRSPQKEEVDIFIEDSKLPVEVKYRNRAGLADADSLLKFMKLQGLKKGIIVTKDILDEKEAGSMKVLFIPAWLFLLLV
ncbi:MAG: ATP-binding protein [Nanoarchaeota archaeon]|nr:ATP-binding protein [Nanoarchaeota archaeon]